MKRTAWLALIGVCLFLLAGCVESGGAGADSDKHPVFYGGVSGGGTRP